MGTHVNSEYLNALSDGNIIQFKYINSQHEHDILDDFWIDLVDHEWGMNSGAAAQLISGSGDKFAFRVKE